MSKQKQYLRFSIFQRLEHWLMVISFTILAVTGLPQKYVGFPLAEQVIAALGGIEFIRIIHRYAATTLMVVSIYHGGVVTYKVFVKRVQLSMMPGLQDAKDLLSMLAYNLGFRKEHPKLPRYNFEEKLEYWALIWGTVVMIITGFMLWNPIATAKFLPGSFIPAAKAAHGAEAVLAVLAVLIWHMYGVHLKKFNKSMFTGKLSATEMAHDHALELEQIERGSVPQPNSTPAGVARRTRIFIPVAIVIAAVLLSTLYIFITFEETAISTVEIPPQVEEPYQPLQISEASGRIHSTIQQYIGPESCAVSGCHTAYPVDNAAASRHGQRITAIGPVPALAKLANANIKADTATLDCLICHAAEYNPDDLLASARTARAAGGQTCLRCHQGHSESDVHSSVGLSCVSCHQAGNHNIATHVECQTCHLEKPHTDPYINTLHERVDCLSCHISGGATVTINASESLSTRDGITGFYFPQASTEPASPVFAWRTPTGQPATIDDPDAIIVPLRTMTILAPKDFDPAAFANTGSGGSGANQPTTIRTAIAHNIVKEGARTCQDCHGPDSDFSFADLGFDEETTGRLSLVKQGN